MKEQSISRIRNGFKLPLVSFIPPFAGEPGEHIELDDELLEDPMVASLTGVNADTQNSEDSY